MLGRIFSALVTVAISVFWLTMMGLLAQREILPAVRARNVPADAAAYDRLEHLVETRPLSQMGIYMGGRRVGWTVVQIEKPLDEIVVRSETRIALDLSPGTGGFSGVLRFKGRMREGLLRDFRFTVRTAPDEPPIGILDGQPVGDVLRLKIRYPADSEPREETIPFDPKSLLSGDLSPTIALPELKVGTKWTMRTVDPMTCAVRTAEAEVIGTEKITVEDVEEEACVVAVQYGSYKVTLWARPDGEILRQKILGFTFLREKPTEGLDWKEP